MRKWTLPSGETLPLGIDLDELENSVHGIHAAESVYCSDCHADRRGYRYPHEPNPAEDLGEFRAEISENCERCHTTLESHNPGHLLATDNPYIPVCADCHGGHDVEPVEAMAADPIGTCQSCHATYGDPRVQFAHDEIVANLGDGQDCQTCHGDEVQSEDAQCQTCHSLLTSQLELGFGRDRGSACRSADDHAIRPW